jgi:hypothetical protein
MRPAGKKKNERLGSRGGTPSRQGLKIALDAAWSMITLGGIPSGIITPTEAGAIVVVYAFFVTMFISRRVKWSELPQLVARYAHGRHHHDSQFGRRAAGAADRTDHGGRLRHRQGLDGGRLAQHPDLSTCRWWSCCCWRPTSQPSRYGCRQSRWGNSAQRICRSGKSRCDLPRARAMFPLISVRQSLFSPRISSDIASRGAWPIPVTGLTI